MTPLYARVFSQILDSSLADDWQARHVFEDLLKLADNGVIDMTRQAISRRTNVPLDVIQKALTVLEAPDPDSRDAAEDGRRLVRLDDHRDWGWRIVNFEKYDAIRNAEDQRAKTAERVRRYREKKTVYTAPLPSASDTDTDTEAALQKRYTPLQTVTDPPSKQLKRVAAATPASDEGWLKELAADPAFGGLDVPREHAKMLRYCKENKREPTRRRFVNWLNRADRPTGATTAAVAKKPYSPNI